MQVDVSALPLVGKTKEATDEADDDIECCEAATNDGRLRTASRFSRDDMMTMLCGRKITMRVSTPIVRGLRYQIFRIVS